VIHTNTLTVTVGLPFGKHKGVPTDYLRWVIDACKLSSGLRAAVANELTKRGIDVPAPPPPRPIRPCPRCGGVGSFVFWQEDRAGRRRISARCKQCHRHLTFPPCVEPYLSMANAAASQTPILDALVRLEELGVEVHSDGQRAWIEYEDWNKVPADLHAIVRQCSHQLARMLGNTERTPA
jgi:hypothetical protein